MCRIHKWEAVLVFEEEEGGLCGIFAVLIHACSCFTRKRTSAPSNLLEVTIEDRRQVKPSIRFGRKECRCSVTCLFPVPDSAMESQFFGLFDLVAVVRMSDEFIKLYYRL
ncbi:hypothetical protein V9T40_013606 [Parthenolecanium corni]|uniref:Uncharacterized protein n=1 Tax=Parthenolecanium corni TaxID=536013 RepID=A0AAN9Y2S2_9HEMI